MDNMEKLIFTDDNGEQAELYVWEETRVAGVNYLLVSEEPDEDAPVFIFKELGEKDGELSYEPVEDDHELEYIGRIFEELLNEEEEEKQDIKQ